ncbi:thiopeptide-type bacteriocin biosynthesis protein [Streptomyces fradiae]|uniref:thiopeptide-type bacteriocin biosynthesis protein n=1 Tax=Streptomyces fradiae TaxID=1906 RepID=UPI0035BE91CF
MLQVERLLADCLHDVRSGPPGTLPLDPEGDAYAAARRTFLAAGLRALRDAGRPGGGWAQVGIAPDGAHAWPALYRRLAGTARELTASGSADDFFFVHKPPGLRVRFHAPGPDGADALRAELVRLLGTAREGWAEPVPSVYEPESYLYGGARSMAYAHRLHTADALAWPDHHTGERPPANWRVSLTLLRAVLDGLGVVGWEHRGVWEAVREEAGAAAPRRTGRGRPGAGRRGGARLLGTVRPGPPGGTARGVAGPGGRAPGRPARGGRRVADGLLRVRRGAAGAARGRRPLGGLPLEPGALPGGPAGAAHRGARRRREGVT